jgi:hypothetical protein
MDRELHALAKQRFLCLLPVLVTLALFVACFDVDVVCPVRNLIVRGNCDGSGIPCRLRFGSCGRILRM